MKLVLMPIAALSILVSLTGCATGPDPKKIAAAEAKVTGLAISKAATDLTTCTDGFVFQTNSDSEYLSMMGWVQTKGCYQEFQKSMRKFASGSTFKTHYNEVLIQAAAVEDACGYVAINTTSTIAYNSAFQTEKTAEMALDTAIMRLKLDYGL